MNASQAALFGSCQLAAQGGLLGGLGGIGGLGSPATFFPAGLDLAAHLQLQRQYNSSLSSLQQHLQQQQQSSGPSSQPASLPPSGGGSQQPQQMAAAAAAAAAAASPFNPTQSPLLSPFFASRWLIPNDNSNNSRILSSHRRTGRMFADWLEWCRKSESKRRPSQILQ